MNDRPSDQVSIRLLGRFQVVIDDQATAEQQWTRRGAAALVKILAMAPGHRLHREQVMDLLWPDEAPVEAAPKLHKAAHFARKAAGPDCIVLRNDIVMLFPASDLHVDVTEFEQRSQRALADGEPATAQTAIASYTGELLPDDRYEEWAIERRELLRLRHLHMLRLAGRWVELGELEEGLAEGGGPCQPPEVAALVAQLAALAERQAALLAALGALTATPSAMFGS